MAVNAVPAGTAVANPAPRWRGFNLLYLFARDSDGVIAPDDFRWIADWGFDFVRLPMSYLHWVEDRDPYRIREATLVRIDQAVDLVHRDTREFDGGDCRAVHQVALCHNDAFRIRLVELNRKLNVGVDH